MRINNIKGSMGIEAITFKVLQVLETLKFDGRVDTEGPASNRQIHIREVRLRHKTFHYYLYHNPFNRNWAIDPEPDVHKPLAENVHFPMTMPIRRGRFLQWRDWANLDNAVNQMLDEFGISASFKSAGFPELRSGYDWNAINPDLYDIPELNKENEE